MAYNLSDFSKKVVDKLKDMSYSKRAVAERHSKI